MVILLYRIRPAYDLSAVKELASQGKFSATKRVRGWLRNHGYNDVDTITSVLAELDESDYYKTDELQVLEGTLADIYRATIDDEEWYVKFFIDSDTGALRVRIMSFCLDGYQH